ncbi:MAG: hypothetical protein JJ979_19315 [Roseibium sp.]|nr:hypothetical protein [Roseibium sp.]
MSDLHGMSPEAQQAVIIERLDRMAADMHEHRRQTEEQIGEIKTAVTSVNNKLERNSATLNRAKGGYLVILGLGSLLAYALDVWGKFIAIFVK